MIKSTDHIGISVVDLARSIEFYCRGLGMTIVEQEGFAGEQYEKMLALKGTHGKLALLRAGNLQLELFQFTSPVPKRNDPNRPVADHGITHFCIEVSDIQAVYAQLEAAGASFHSPPIEFEGFATATYVRDPDGNVFEIMERGKQVESE